MSDLEVERIVANSRRITTPIRNGNAMLVHRGDRRITRKLRYCRDALGTLPAMNRTGEVHFLVSAFRVERAFVPAAGA